jgi:hypothetical protein
LGWNGTLVDTPQSSQHTCVVLSGAFPLRWARSKMRQFGQRFGSFTRPFAWKNSCSPAEKTNDELQSQQLRILSVMVDISYLPGIIVSFVVWHIVDQILTR